MVENTLFRLCPSYLYVEDNFKYKVDDAPTLESTLTRIQIKCSKIRTLSETRDFECQD